MPHFVIEYSSNLESSLDLQDLAASLRDTAVETGVFPLAGIRVRCHRCDIFEIADGDAAHGFMHIVLRIGAGRSIEVRRKAGEEIFNHLQEQLKSLIIGTSFALSFEIVEIHPELTFKKNTVRDYLSGRVPAGDK